ncbi:Taurine import ATP-binding protein TauB [compost metagenome]
MIQQAERWVQFEQASISQTYTSEAAQSVDLRHIGLSYTSGKKKTEVLDNIDLSFVEGEFVCVLGPSGCGKTSLLRVIAGYEKPTYGEVHIFGRKHTGPHEDVGVVFQHANLFPWLTVRSNVEFGLKMLGLDPAKRITIADTYIEQVGLTRYASMLPYQLSGGMKQRTAIARTLATSPHLILMDEPFAALDAITREVLQSQIRHIGLNSRKTIFFITHDVDEALLLSSRILVMQGSPGRIVTDMVNPLFQGSQSFEEIRKRTEYPELREYLVNRLKQAK